MVGEDPFEEKAKGEFCQIDLTIVNGSTEPINLSGFNFSGYIGDAKYESSSTENVFGDDVYATDVNPGLNTSGKIYIDIPAGSVLETVEYSDFLSFDDALAVKVS